MRKPRVIRNALNIQHKLLYLAQSLAIYRFSKGMVGIFIPFVILQGGDTLALDDVRALFIAAFALGAAIIWGTFLFTRISESRRPSGPVSAAAMERA